MIKQSLHDNWTVRAVADLSEVPAALHGVAVPARVPGCVHTDLMRAGKIVDPYRDLNEFATRWIGHTDWEYRTTFDADARLFDHERIDLVCDGLDTVATIVLNGQDVAQTQNMHRGYRFDVRSLLRRGSNDLVITFASPVKYAQRMQRELGGRPYCNGPAGAFNFIRKMACNFGWDWGPALPTSGIWRPIRLEGWSLARVEAMRSNVVFEDRAVVHWIDVKLEEAADTFYSETCLFDPQGRELVENIREPHPEGWQRTGFRIESPQLWWPRGHGDQPLYRVTHEIAATGYEEIVERRIGLRTVELDTSPDDIGAKFVLKVNGKPIFCKGFNWIPDDCFLDRATEPARVRQRIQQAVDAGANVLRVWGGGIYETDAFYDICDEMGVLVWQDFLFACAMYPEEEPFKSEVEAEARYNVARLAHHPSLAIWNGCNENIWAYRDWGWKDSEEVKGRTWGLGYYLNLLPRVIKELDPSRPYWAASPWSGDPDPDNGIHPNADTHGNMHVWRPWFHEDYASYRKFNARFCSEFGFQGPATYSSIASVVPPEARDFGSVEMRHRQQSGNPAQDDGDKRNLRHLIRYFNLPGAQELLDALELPDPKPAAPPCGSAPLHPAQHLPSRVNFDDLHYLLQVNQARALTLGVEWFRSRQPRCMGTLYWQLNDCWPGGTTWSCIDGDGRKKPLWYATRSFFTGYLPTIQPEADGSLSLYLVNDTDGRMVVSNIYARRWSFDTAELLASQAIDCEIGPRAVHRVPLDRAVATPLDPSREFIYFGDETGTFWFFAPDKDLRYSKPRFRCDVDREGDEYSLRVSADTLVRDVCVFADRIDPDATVSDQLVTLFPDEIFTFVIRSKRNLTKEQLTSPPVFRCVNGFGAGL
ncbi:MAG: glycoside hydrolase family 2 TIM barrel-domain containing protein [Tepidisphaeraceae bacterium]